MQSDRRKTPLRDLRTYSASRAPRLDECDYTADIDVHLTICADRGRPFDDPRVAAMVCEAVEYYATKLGHRLYGYCLMPDHLHVLLSPGSSGVSVLEWSRQFKSLTTSKYRKQTTTPVLWQRSAFDHVCRKAETAEAVLGYIIENPCRAGLAERWQDWPWTKVFIAL
jgi:putative transposase